MKAAVLLAVDDNPDALELICDAFTEEGHLVICARSGPEALRILQTQHVDVALVDIRMPDMNGFALLEVIRATPGLEQLPVIMQTADPSREHGRRVVDSRVSYMLAKPLNIELLLDAVHECLQVPRQGSAVSCERQ